MTPAEKDLADALRPFALVAAHMDPDELDSDDTVILDRDHPDIGLTAQHFKHAYQALVRRDPAFRNEVRRRPDLVERTFGHPRWGYLYFTILGLAGGYVAAKSPEWAQAMSLAITN